MGTGYHGGFGQTKGNSTHSKIFHADRQGKHIIGHKTGKKYPTTMGIIHTSKDGSHIVPSKPKNLKGEWYYVFYKERTISNWNFL